MTETPRTDISERPVERVYDMVRRGILDGTFASGEPLREQQLATLSDTSRTPVREALRRLISEGLVVMGSNRRCRVAQFTPSEVQSVYEIRTRLESYAAELACERIDAAGVARLHDINARIEALGPEVSKDSVNRFLDINSEFHLEIVRIAGSHQLEAALSSALMMPLVLLKHYVWDDVVRLELSHQQHREIILAIDSGNRRWAGACMASHIQTSRPPAITDGRPESRLP